MSNHPSLKRILQIIDEVKREKPEAKYLRFPEEAQLLTIEVTKDIGIAGASRATGISVSAIHKWIKKYGSNKKKTSPPKAKKSASIPEVKLYELPLNSIGTQSTSLNVNENLAAKNIVITTADGNKISIPADPVFVDKALASFLGGAK